MRNTLNLNIRPQRQLLDGNARPRRLWVREIGIVDAVDGGEVVHGGEVDPHADDVVE